MSSSEKEKEEEESPESPQVNQKRSASSLCGGAFVDERDSLADQIKRQKVELDRLKLQLTSVYKKIQGFEEFCETMGSGSCLICNEDMRNCIGTPAMAVVSYACKCSIRRVIHLGCWTQAFNCACGVSPKLHVEAGDGKKVRIYITGSGASGLFCPHE